MLNELQTLYRGNGNSAIDMTWLRWLAQDDAAQQKLYTTYRQYYEGQHNVPLTDRQKEYLEVEGIEFRSNYLRLPVQVLAQRMKVIGFTLDEEESEDLWVWWELNKMDGMQNNVHEQAIVDGDTFILVEWDNEENIPRFFHEQAYDGEEGVKVHYRESARQKISFASKRWRVITDDGKTERRLNIYAADAIYKYIMGGQGRSEATWQPYEEEGIPWPIPWPLDFIPIVHFKHNDCGLNWGRSDLEDLIPDQKALNKSVLDLLEVSDKTAFQIITLSGGVAVDDKGVPYKVQPRSILGHKDGTWGYIPSGDLDKLRALKQDFIIAIAQKSQVPLQYFQLTGQIASSETQSADDSNLVARVEWYITPYGNAWEAVMQYAMEMAGEFGSGYAKTEGRKVIGTVWDTLERVDKISHSLRQSEIVANIVTSGGSLRGALLFAEVPPALIDAIVSLDGQPVVQQ